MRKTYLNKEWRYHTFEPEKVHFCSTFEVTAVLFCHDIPGLLKELGLSTYNPNEWQMFIDSSKRSLKCVLLHNGNLFGAIPIGHSVFLREEHGDVKRVIELMQYDKNN